MTLAFVIINAIFWPVLIGILVRARRESARIRAIADDLDSGRHFPGGRPSSGGGA